MFCSCFVHVLFILFQFMNLFVVGVFNNLNWLVVFFTNLQMLGSEKDRKSTTYNHRALNDAEDAIEAMSHPASWQFWWLFFVKARQS